MKLRKILSVVVFLSSPMPLLAGGSVGGGTAALQLDLLGEALTRTQFEALVQTGLKGGSIEIDGQPAEVRRVDFETRRIEVLIQGRPEHTVLLESPAVE